MILLISSLILFLLNGSFVEDATTVKYFVSSLGVIPSIYTEIQGLGNDTKWIQHLRRIQGSEGDSMIQQKQKVQQIQ